MSRLVLTGIQPQAWEHPADRMASKAVKGLPGMETAVRTFLSYTTEQSLKMVALASAAKVGPRQFGRVHALHVEACRILDLAEVPDVFISPYPFLKEGATGMKQPFVVLRPMVVESLTDDELLGLLGREVGHIRSGHVVFKTLLALISRLDASIKGMTVGGIAIAAIAAGLREWDRKSELSADRAGLLTTQDTKAAAHLLMKWVGGIHTGEMDIESLRAQAAAYHQSENLRDSMYKLLHLTGQAHQFPVLRLDELLRWAESGQYQHLLQGGYHIQPHSIEEDVLETGRNYAEEAKRAAKPIIEAFEQAREQAKDQWDQTSPQLDAAKMKAKEWLEGIFKRG